MNLMEKENNWIDNVIKQHKKQLEDIKKSRSTIDEIEERSMMKNKENLRSTNENMTSIEINDEDNLFKNNLEIKDNDYMNIKENYHVDILKKGDKDFTNIPQFSFDNNFGSITKNSDYDRYQTYQSYQSIKPKNNQSNSQIENETNFKQHSVKEENLLQAKLDTKKLRLREMKKQFKITCEENALLKLKLGDLEKYKQTAEVKIETLNNELKSSEIRYLKREKELEQEKAKAEEKLTKILSLDNVKSQEIKMMHDKIRNFEMKFNENEHQHTFSNQSLKSELDDYKQKHSNYEKSFEILNIFLKKIQTYICGSNVANGSPKNLNRKNEENTKESFNCIDKKYLQSKLIEIENFIIKLINEKSAISQKYSKILDIQSKLAQSESLDNSQYHLENVKKLSEKIYDLNEENKFLKKQLEKFLSDNQEKSIINNNHNDGTSLLFNKTDKDNIFTNNFIKEKISKSKNPVHTEENINLNLGNKNTIPENSSSRVLLESYRTLEHRVRDLENELRQKENFRDSLYYYSDNKKDLSQDKNRPIQRSKSNAKIITSPSHNNLKSDNLVIFKSNKAKKKKTKIKLVAESIKTLQEINPPVLKKIQD